ncbi:MAG: phosphate signaling complex protein PhoU [Ilumatobacteraceae bacterium]
MSELRQGFQDDLDRIRKQVSTVGAYIVELIPRVTDIMLSNDLKAAEVVIRADKDIDERVLETEELILKVLALQSPVAGDLREVTSALKIIADMERSADLACNICKASRRIHGYEMDPKLRGLIQKLGDQAAKEYRKAVNSYVNRDAMESAALGDIDELLDNLQRQFLQQIIESHSAQTIELQVAVQLTLVARFYERLGDHAVNLASRVRFIEEGTFPELHVSDRELSEEVGSPFGPTGSD